VRDFGGVNNGNMSEPDKRGEGTTGVRLHSSQLRGLRSKREPDGVNERAEITLALCVFLNSYS